MVSRPGVGPRPTGLAQSGLVTGALKIFAPCAMLGQVLLRFGKGEGEKLTDSV